MGLSEKIGYTKNPPRNHDTRSQGYFGLWFPWLFLCVICIEWAPQKDIELVGGFKQLLFSIIYGMSSFPLTKSIIFQDGYYNTTKQYTSIPSCVSRILVPSCFPRFPTFLSSLRKKKTTARFTAAAGFHQFSPRRSAPQKNNGCCGCRRAKSGGCTLW